MYNSGVPLFQETTILSDWNRHIVWLMNRKTADWTPGGYVTSCLYNEDVLNLGHTSPKLCVFWFRVSPILPKKMKHRFNSFQGKLFEGLPFYKPEPPLVDSTVTWGYPTGTQQIPNRSLDVLLCLTCLHYNLLRLGTHMQNIHGTI